MPYRHAHWYILALVPLIALAFWPSYWSVIGSADWTFHLHGATAMAWLALLAAQSWSIQHGQRALHRATGLSSLALFPLFLAGGIAILFGMAGKMIAGSEFHGLFAARLVWLDMASVAMMAFFYHEALRHRRRVKLHSAFMLATAIALLPPIFGRLSAIPLGVTGPGTFDRMYPGFIAGQVLAAAVALAIARGRGADGRPWLIAAAITLLGGAAFASVGGSVWWREAYAMTATLSPLPFMAVTFVTGAAVAWSGWQAGRRSVGPALTA